MKKILFLFLFLLIACKPSYVKSILPESQVSSSLTISEGRLIAFLENNLNADGSVSIPVALRPYMGGQDRIG